jgi:hypothetical protein
MGLFPFYLPVTFPVNYHHDRIKPAKENELQLILALFVMLVQTVSYTALCVYAHHNQPFIQIS